MPLMEVSYTEISRLRFLQGAKHNHFEILAHFKLQTATMTCSKIYEA